MTNYETRERALELALRAARRDESIVDIVAAASEFEKYLSGAEASASPGAFTEPVKPGAFAEALKRGQVKTGTTVLAAGLLNEALGVRGDIIARLNEDSQGIIRRALTEALQLGHNKIAPEHLLLAIIRDGCTTAAAALIDMAGSGKSARQAVIKRIAGEHR